MGDELLPWQQTTASRRGTAIIWLLFKLTLGIAWPAVALGMNPSGLAPIFGPPLVFLWAPITILGTVTSLVGLALSVRPGMPGVVGVSIELVGLSFMLTGPLCYALALWGELTHHPPTDYVHAALFATAVVFGVLVRITTVWANRRMLLEHPPPTPPPDGGVPEALGET